MKIETFLDSYGVRNMCIAHDYCTCMDNDQYSKMLNWVNETTFGVTETKPLEGGFETGTDSPAREPENPAPAVATPTIKKATTWIQIMNVPE